MHYSFIHIIILITVLGKDHELTWCLLDSHKSKWFELNTFKGSEECKKLRMCKYAAYWTVFFINFKLSTVNQKRIWGLLYPNRVRIRLTYKQHSIGFNTKIYTSCHLGTIMITNGQIILYTFLYLQIQKRKFLCIISAVQ